MLSDEEKRIIKSVKEEYKKGIEQGNVLFPIFLNQAKILLNLIEKQSKEIEELKEERKKYPIAMNDEQYKKVIELAQKDIKEELNRQINVRMINEEYIEKNYISKDKIKAKIEEVDNTESDKKYTMLFNSDNVMDVVKAVLKSLLEKE